MTIFLWVWEGKREVFLPRREEAKDPPYCGPGSGKFIEMPFPKGKNAKQTLSRWPKEGGSCLTWGTVSIPLPKDLDGGMSQMSDSGEESSKVSSVKYA